MDTDRAKLINWILKTAVVSLASIMIGVVIVLLVALFVPNELVDSKDVLALIGPAFNTVIGAFVGLLGGLSLNEKPEKKEEKKEEPILEQPKEPLQAEPEDEIA